MALPMMRAGRSPVVTGGPGFARFGCLPTSGTIASTMIPTRANPPAMMAAAPIARN
jgi:hypothetical protein